MRERERVFIDLGLELGCVWGWDRPGANKSDVARLSSAPSLSKVDSVCSKVRK